MSLNIVVANQGTPVVTLSGRLDTHTAPELDECLARLLSAEEVPARLVFDLSQLEYLSSAGIPASCARARRWNRRVARWR